MKTIALFGISGKTGSILAKKLVAKKFIVKALVRNPSKVFFSSPKISIIQGDVLNFNQVLDTIRDADAVINVIGHVKGCPKNLQTIATGHIIKAMNELHISRLIDLTGNAVTVEGDNPGIIDRASFFVMKHLAGLAMKNRFNDGVEHTRLIQNSDLEWTVIRAPVLLPKPATAKTYIGMVGHIPGHSLTYDDLVNEIVNILVNKSFIRQLPYITNG